MEIDVHQLDAVNLTEYEAHTAGGVVRMLTLHLRTVPVPIDREQRPVRLPAVVMTVEAALAMADGLRAYALDLQERQRDPLAGPEPGQSLN